MTKAQGSRPAIRYAYEYENGVMRCTRAYAHTEEPTTDKHAMEGHRFRELVEQARTNMRQKANVAIGEMGLAMYATFAAYDQERNQGAIYVDSTMTEDEAYVSQMHAIPEEYTDGSHGHTLILYGKGSTKLMQLTLMDDGAKRLLRWIATHQTDKDNTLQSRQGPIKAYCGGMTRHGRPIQATFTLQLQDRPVYARFRIDNDTDLNLCQGRNLSQKLRRMAEYLTN